MRWISFVVLAACGGSSGPPPKTDPDDGFDRSAMLQHLSTEVLLPIQTTFAARAAALPDAIGAYCDALDATPGASPEAARAAWRDAMAAWQKAEALLVGPAATNDRALRDRIYAWPLLATCRVDRDTASRFAEPASYDISTKLVNEVSLAAVEYLLHTTSTNHTCATTPAGWDALGAELPRARCRLAEVIARDVATQAVSLELAWRTDGGNFVTELAAAGTADSTIPLRQEGLNRISDAMFYADRVVKDMKVGETAGITLNSCGTVATPCLAELEHPFADYETFALRINLRSVREAFTGTTEASDGLGFDDMLRMLGHPEVADRMTASLDAAIAAADTLPDGFTSALANDYAKVAALHTAIAAFTADLKSQFLTLLSLEIPDDVAADND